MLRELKEYAERAPADPNEARIPPEYREQPIRWMVLIDTARKTTSFIQTASETNRGTQAKRFAAPSLRRAGTNIKPQLLADSAEFVFGLPAGADEARADRRHADFLALTEACAEYTDRAELMVIAGVLQHVDAMEIPQELLPSDSLQFQVDGTEVVKLPAVQDFWARVAPKLGEKGVPPLTKELVLSWLEDDVGDVQQNTCVCCGELKAIARVHPVAIRMPRAVADQQVALISANREAFWSYGLEQSYIAPTCRLCAATYARGINRLVLGENTHAVLSNSIFLVWTKEPVEFNFMSTITNPDENFSALLRHLSTDALAPGVEETRLYATCLTGSGARIAVRDWIDTTVGETVGRIRCWYERQRITDGTEDARPLGIYGLGHATVRRRSDGRWDDVPRPTTRALLHAALTGTPLPQDLLYQAVRRNLAEQTVTRPRAALIKLVLCSQPENERWEASMVELDQENTNPAYRCGRLLAVLERAQELAIPGVNASIVDRFFGTASSAPASVFPRLVRGAQPHLAKLQRDSRGAGRALQARIEDILGGLPLKKTGALYTGFPTSLNLQDQGLFSLGYYHQRAFDRAQARAAIERRRAGSVDEPDAELDDYAEPPARD